MIPKSWRKSFNSGVVRPRKMRFCNECNDKISCHRWKLEAKLYLLKRQAPNEYGYVLLLHKL